MKCERCKEREASVYYKESINGIAKEYHLCPKCYSEMKNKLSIDYNPFNLFGGFFEPERKLTDKITEKHCTLCNSTFDDIIKSGKVGCAECYSVFERELEPSIRKIHGGLGHIPNKTEKEEKNLSKTEKLKKELKEAIENEEYEKAAQIRDMIKEEEGKGDE